MSDDELRSLIRQHITMVDKAGSGAISDACEAFKEAGITEDMHVGQTEEFFTNPRHTMEWYAGQFMKCSKELWLINSFLNTLDKFVPEVSIEQSRQPLE